MGLNERGGGTLSMGKKANLEAFNLWHNNKSYKVQDKERYCQKWSTFPH